MQTFLPYRDYTKSAACLDRHRLGKQRLETLEILLILNHYDLEGNQVCILPQYVSINWAVRLQSHTRHPAVLMWHGYTESLVEYGVAVCSEWVRRGYVDRLTRMVSSFSWGDESATPHWLTEEFCRRHRSNLLRKNPRYYRKFNWGVPDDLPYLWPIF